MRNMARIIPSDISPLALAGAHSRELKTLALLKEPLGPNYAVFHSVHWSFSQGQGTHFAQRQSGGTDPHVKTR